MTTTKPIIDPSARLELRDAAAALGVTKSTILRWSAEGRLACGVKKCNGRRFWTGSELIKFWKSEY